MKRLAVLFAVIGLLATTVGAGPASAATPANPANLTVSPVNTKKVEATWSDWKSIEPATAFDAYWVVADDDSNFTPFTADRGRFVDDTASRSVVFDDLTSGTPYFFAVYAVSYTTTGVLVVPPDGTSANTPIGAVTGTYSPLTIKVSKQTVVSGKSVTVTGTLEDSSGKPVPDATVSVTSDPYPAGSPLSIGTTKTNVDGQWSLTSSALSANTQFWANYLPSEGIGGWTGRVPVEVRKKISVTVSPGTTVAAGTTVKFTGQVSGDPAFLDDGGGMAKICLQKRTTKWGSLKCVDINTDGSYLLKFSPGTSAGGKYRVFSGMGPAYGNSWSRPKTITVS